MASRYIEHFKSIDARDSERNITRLAGSEPGVWHTVQSLCTEIELARRWLRQHEDMLLNTHLVAAIVWTARMAPCRSR